MSLESADVGQGADAINVVQVTGDNAVMSTREAAQMLAGLRHKKTDAETPQAEAERQEPAAREPAQESSQEDAAPLEAEAPGETQEAEPAEQPPIEPPRSWTKEARERFASLPRDTQEYLASREQDREHEVRRVQNEAAEQRKAIEAERGKVDQARQQYEQALPALLQTIQQQMAGEFSDIKTMDDVNKLAATDWPRYVMWDAKQKQIASVQLEATRATERQTQEKQTKLGEYIAQQSKLISEKIPDMADPAKRDKLQKSAATLLTDIGFADSELGELFHGQKEGISLHDHRLQLLIHDAMRYRAGQAALKTAPKPVPQVQRPGVSQPRGAQQDAVVQSLTKRLESTGSVKDAARLLMERRKAAR